VGKAASYSVCVYTHQGPCRKCFTGFTRMHELMPRTGVAAGRAASSSNVQAGSSGCVILGMFLFSFHNAQTYIDWLAHGRPGPGSRLFRLGSTKRLQHVGVVRRLVCFLDVVFAGDLFT
jgi:hypothetical protein